MQTPIAATKAFYSRNARWIPVLFFILGFLADALLLQRIDDLFTILQQAAYLIFAGWLIGLELLESCGKYHPGDGRWARLWRYREAAIHFALGALLNAYTMFFFMSASVLTSFIFIGVLVAVLILNEFMRFGRSQTFVHMALWSLCVLSFSLCVVPTLVGFIGFGPFLMAVACSLAAGVLFCLRLRRSAGENKGKVDRHAFLPVALVHVIFIALYYARVIPPVPLSVSFIGIYHGLTKAEGKYFLTYSDTSWKILGNGDVDFRARPDDKIYCFARIFSPTNFKDQLVVRWLLKDPKRGWESQDAIPLPVTGGREKGFRGYTVKNHYSEGTWRCQVETSDGREIGRLTFKVTLDPTVTERSLALQVE